VTHPERKAAADDADSEQRRFPRLSCDGIAHLRVIPNGGRETGCVVNLSKRGCCFVADKPLRGIAGSGIEVHLRVRGIDLRVPGIIRHIRKRVRAGIEFVDLSDRKRDQIDELIGELSILENQAKKLHQEPCMKPDDNCVERADCGRTDGDVRAREVTLLRIDSRQM
jgi:hypothetical protein